MQGGKQPKIDLRVSVITTVAMTHNVMAVPESAACTSCLSAPLRASATSGSKDVPPRRRTPRRRLMYDDSCLSEP